MEHHELLQELNACVNVCNICYEACLNEEDVAMMTRCIELDRECSDICQLTASMLSRDSENIDKFLKLCSEICSDCADECAKHDYDHCRECSKVCRKCSELCLEHQPQE